MCRIFLALCTATFQRSSNCLMNKMYSHHALPLFLIFAFSTLGLQYVLNQKSRLSLVWTLTSKKSKLLMWYFTAAQACSRGWTLTISHTYGRYLPCTPGRPHIPFSVYQLPVASSQQLFVLLLLFYLPGEAQWIYDICVIAGAGTITRILSMIELRFEPAKEHWKRPVWNSYRVHVFLPMKKNSTTLLI